MKFKLKKIVVGGVATALLAGGGLAYAYWTTTGNGSGSATVAASNGTVTLHATLANGITPGGSKTVTFTGDNAGSTDLQVGTIHSVVSTSDAACLASDFSIADVVSNTVVGHGLSGVALGSGTLNMANSALSQDACKGATVTLTLSSN